jgi:hypothetical protein
MGKMKNVYKTLLGYPEGKNHLAGVGVCGGIILECNL